jgi:hypothetical protein
MKPVTLVALLVAVFAGCEKKEEEKVTQTLSYEVMQHPAWTEESFKTNYTIQFPPVYKGRMTGFEGNVFSKIDTVNKTYIGYCYSNSLYCSDFKDILTNPFQPAILYVFLQNHPPELLGHRVEFTSNGHLTGVLYHNNAASMKGILFWKDEGLFKEAAFVNGLLPGLPEVVSILRTIKAK